MVCFLILCLDYFEVAIRKYEVYITSITLKAGKKMLQSLPILDQL